MSFSNFVRGAIVRTTSKTVRGARLVKEAVKEGIADTAELGEEARKAKLARDIQRMREMLESMESMKSKQEVSE